MVRRYSPKRPTPSEGTITARREFLGRLRTLPPTMPTASDLGLALEPGNSKLGQSGSHAGSVFVWNLPSVATCPGASEWCTAHCYNADDRVAKFPVGAWARNWGWALRDPRAVEKAIVGQLAIAAPPAAVRIHSSGDFFSIAYVELWIRICRACPDTRFWAYTRSWAIPELRPSLEELRSLSNIQLFASWDTTMRGPPSGWRLSFVGPGRASDVEDGALLSCPEQDGRLPDCAACGYCFLPRNGHVRFDVH